MLRNLQSPVSNLNTFDLTTMLEYMIRRLIQGFITLMAISVIVFALASAYPGGIMSAYEENPDVTAEDYARLRAKYGLDDPVPLRYMKWMGNVATRASRLSRNVQCSTKLATGLATPCY